MTLGAAAPPELTSPAIATLAIAGAAGASVAIGRFGEAWRLGERATRWRFLAYVTRGVTLCCGAAARGGGWTTRGRTIWIRSMCVKLIVSTGTLPPLVQTKAGIASAASR